jgi:glycosyltransferase involved in cell wall biosynthesis
LFQGDFILKILVLEPYFGGSHRSFLQGLQQHLEYDFDLLTLPPRKWKWRMRLAAPYFVEQLNTLDTGKQYDRILCSSFVDVATFRSLVHERFRQIPFYTYFHENQFAYPVQKKDERDFHFGLTNLTTILASDKVAFNTRYNLDTLIVGARKLLRICPDMKLGNLIKQIQDKAVILNPGIDFSDFSEPDTCKRDTDSPPVIVWNHRWEHDKDPEYFFNTLYELDNDNVDFRLVVLGQSFQRRPDIFDEARKRLSHKILHFGYVESRQKYIRLLCKADIVVSTARHEFYGISVVEAVRAGCIPVLPNHLSYPELFPAEYLYEKGELYAKLESFLKVSIRLDNPKARALTERLSWSKLKDNYIEWFKG